MKMSREDFAKLSKEEQDKIIAKAAEMQEQAKKDDEPTLKQLTMPEFKSMIEDTLKKQVESMTKIDKKYFMYPGIGKEGKDDTTPEGKFTKTIRFLKAVSGLEGGRQTVRAMSDEVRKKANLSEGTTTAGGFLVPEEFAAEILRLAPQYGVARSNCRIIPMSRDVIHFPAAGTTDITAHWTNEASTIYGTNPNFRQVTLTINKLASVQKVTPELLSDANVNVVQYLSELIAEAFAKEEDTQAFIGTGSPFVGAMNATGVPTAYHASGTGFECLSYPDLVKIPSYTYSLPNGKYYFHRTMIAHMRSLITTAGAPIFPAQANSVVGYPVVSTEILPGIGHAAYRTDATTYAIFGDFRRGMLMGERGTVEMRMSEHATVGGDNLFEQDMLALRFLERVTFGCALPSAFVKILS